ncbi:c-type cytochrome [Guyparkeria sp. SCN-R1]|uniref:c-type cytochrome n=1 Tax=unclassified Guyparkeria TaxID=2626246 RepID=UPI001315118D|nr:c-type cytochrome [Guyparkeria sp. SCN-R1]
MSQNREAAIGRRLSTASLAAIGLGLMLAAGMSQAESDTERMEMSTGSIIGATCMGCHGFQGQGSGDIPRLAGVAKEATAGKLLEYKSGALEGTVMNRIAKGYTDDEIQAVAEFFAKQ